MSGVTVSIAAFQAVDPGSTPGSRTFFFPFLFPFPVVFFFFFFFFFFSVILLYFYRVIIFFLSCVLIGDWRERGEGC